MFSDVPSGINIIIYPSVIKWNESNIGLFLNYKLSQPSFLKAGKRAILTYNGNNDDLIDQLNESLARLVWENQVKISLTDDKKTEGNVPIWFKEGSIRYFAHGWRIEDEDALRLSFKKENFENWQQLTDYQPYLAGQAFCYFLNQVYFRQAAAQTIFQLKTKKTLGRAIRLIAKEEIDSITQYCYIFYRNRCKSNINGNELESINRSICLPAPKGLLQSICISPDRNYLAYISQIDNTKTVNITNLNTKTTKSVSKYQLIPWVNNHNIDQYPLLSWSEFGNELIVLQPSSGKIAISKYLVNGEMIERKELKGLEGVSSFRSVYEQNLLLSAYRKGQNDIVWYNMTNDKISTVTDDIYTDLQPTIVNDVICWIGNRPLNEKQEPKVIRGNGISADNLWQGIFLNRAGKINYVLGDTIVYCRYSNPNIINDSTILFTTSKNGIEQNGIVNINDRTRSIFSNVDKIQFLPQTKEIITYVHFKDSLLLNISPVVNWLSTQKKATDSSIWLKEYSIHKQEDEQIEKQTRNKDTARYFVEKIVNTGANSVNNRQRKTKQTNTQADLKNYYIKLYSSYFTAQLNNDYFINKYQPYVAYQGQFKFPEIGALTKCGFSDLFENHHISLAFRLPSVTEGSDFNIKYENTERKVDWGLIYFRKTETLQFDGNRNWVDEYGRLYPSNAKVKTNYYEAYVRKPLSYYSAIQLHSALRLDKTIFLATDKYSLDFQSLKNAWSINTLQYIYSRKKIPKNIINSGIEILTMIDVFHNFNEEDATVIGVSGSTIWQKPLNSWLGSSIKFNFGYSGGDQKILFDMGGVDNNLTPLRDTSKIFQQNYPYAFHTLVSSLRGYPQGALYGDQFILLNIDLYVPIFKTLIPIATPLSFVNNMQPGVFVDLGLARERWLSKNAASNLSFGFSFSTTLANYNLKFDYGWPGTTSKKPIWYFSVFI